MKVLDLFSGIGGFSLGLERAGMETVAFCEYDEKCRQVLKKHWPDVPQYTDVRTLTGEQLKNDGITDIGVICGGFPCQPYSQAGQQRGADDDRALWPEMFRIVKDVRPDWVLGENTPPFARMGFDEAASGLENIGYAVQAFLIPACAVNAIHRRERIWIVAHAASGHDRERLNKPTERQKPEPGESSIRNDMGRKICPNSDIWKSQNGRDLAGVGGYWELDETNGIKVPANKPVICRGDDGVPGRVDRLKQLGNAVVPQIPEVIGRAIMAAREAA